MYPATPVPVSVLAFHEKVMVELLLTVTAGDAGTVGAVVSGAGKGDEAGVLAVTAVVKALWLGNEAAS